jgi:protein SCO1/2
MRLLLVVAALAALTACGGSKQQLSNAPIQKYQIHGVIQKLNPDVHSATIKHRNIEGFMEAMTMEFPIRNKDEYSKLQVGETIDGTVFVQDTDFWVGDIHESHDSK